MLWLGMAGFAPAQRASLEAALGSSTGSSRWRVCSFGDADGWWVNGAKASLLAGGTLKVAAGLPTERALKLDDLRQLRDREGFDLESTIVDRFAAHLPDPIWVVELSAPELFPASRRKFGEILVTASPASPGALPEIVGARLPGAVFLVKAGNFHPERTRLAGHTALYSYSTT